FVEDRFGSQQGKGQLFPVLDKQQAVRQEARVRQKCPKQVTKLPEGMNHPFSRQPGQPVANPVHVPIIQKDPQGQQDQQSRLGIISAAQGIEELVDAFGQIPSAVVPHSVIQDRPEQEKQGDEEKGAHATAAPPDSQTDAEGGEGRDDGVTGYHLGGEIAGLEIPRKQVEKFPVNHLAVPDAEAVAPDFSGSQPAGHLLHHLKPTPDSRPDQSIVAQAEGGRPSGKPQINEQGEQLEDFLGNRRHHGHAPPIGGLPAEKEMNDGHKPLGDKGDYPSPHQKKRGIGFPGERLASGQDPKLPQQIKAPQKL